MRWIEDPVFLTNPTGIQELKRTVRSRIAMGETRGGADDFKIFLDTGALSLLILDIGWCGGLTEARRCAALAGAYLTPVAAHDCNGPGRIERFGPFLSSHTQCLCAGNRTGVLLRLVC
ncbi:MAG: hypothetical protein CM1200mP18_02950 [Gammaproteobacteria bacterium]|nr:MAG: hypothetical protein CM1200mP18_02950 [Gammaproteobacteria bacterium]